MQQVDTELDRIANSLSDISLQVQLLYSLPT
jgi:hypothetical protein